MATAEERAAAQYQRKRERNTYQYFRQAVTAAGVTRVDVVARAATPPPRAGDVSAARRCPSRTPVRPEQVERVDERLIEC